MGALRIAVLAVGLLAGVAGDARAAASPVRGCLDAGCHRALVERAGVHRPAVEEDCADCHAIDPSGGDAPEYHSGVVAGSFGPARHDEAVCGTCHQDALLGMRSPPRFGESNSAPATSQGTHRHGPLADGDCGGCHRAHGESAAGLTRGELPTGAYARYAADRYSACLGACHPAEIIEASPAGDATAFRNGGRNLHRVHVVLPRSGRSCLLCHDPHAAPNAALVRRGMPFGKERLTLRFEERENGGRCTTSCHIPLEYDREQEVPSRMRTNLPSNTPESP